MAIRDPILDLQRSTRRLAAAGGAAALAVGVWAFWPIRAEPLRLADVGVGVGVGQSDPAGKDSVAPKIAFNAAAFDAPLWTPPPPPPSKPVAQKPPPPPPLKLQLIGISRDNGTDGTPILRGVLYDPDSDRLLIVASGEKIELAGRQPILIAKLTADAIELQDGDITRRLTLSDERRQP